MESKSGGDARNEGPRAAPGAERPLTCLNNTNSISAEENQDKKANEIRAVRIVRTLSGTAVVEQVDGNGRRHHLKLSAYEYQVKFQMEENIKFWAKEYGLERMIFGTLTTRDKPDWKEFQRRVNSFRTNCLNKAFSSVPLMVRESHKSGQWHIHYLGLVDFDARTGFDFENHKKARMEFGANKYSKLYRKLTKAYASKAHPELRKIWKLTKDSRKGHGFGYHEAIPIRTTHEAIARYVSKYLGKALQARRNAPPRSRMVSYSRGIRRGVRGRVGWVSAGAIENRRKTGKFANLVGANEDNIMKLLGSKWRWKYQCDIHHVDRLDPNKPGTRKWLADMRQGKQPPSLLLDKNVGTEKWVIFKDGQSSEIDYPLTPKQLARKLETREERTARMEREFPKRAPDQRPPLKLSRQWSLGDLRHFIP